MTERTLAADRAVRDLDSCRVARTAIAWLLVALLAGCASLQSNFKQPGVSVVAVTPRVLNSMTPEFDILLRVTNPNRRALEIRGISYQVLLAGNKLVEGVASDFPSIAAYGEAEVVLHARADLIGGLGLLSRLIEDPRAAIDYEFNAEIDIGALYPTIRVNRVGAVSL